MAACLLAPIVVQAAADIPQDKLAAVEASLTSAAAARSEARQRLSVRRVIRSADALLEAHPDAPNRFELLGTLYHARQRLLSLDGAKENREALLDVCRRLVEAPDAYAEARFDAELLLCQIEQARKGATPTERVGALRPFIERYRNTSVEKRMLQSLTIMTLELGNDALLFDLRQAIAERCWHDLEMIGFTNKKLGGEVLAAPFVANLKASDGTTLVFPMDRLGRSTLFFAWSKDAEDLDERITKWNTLAGTASGPKDANVTHRLSPGILDIISLNLDELPDAGESILREKGVDWQALHLPGGRNSEIYRTYFRWDPMGLHVSPSGCAALLLPGSHSDDYPRRVWSYAQRNEYYLRQLQSFFTGEFLVVDPIADFDPSAPPELKACAPENETSVLLARTAASLPTNVLQGIQSCFVPPPMSYRLSQGEALKNYQNAETLCRKAIAAHPQAPDVWLAHNRLITALTGQWRLTCDPTFLVRAGEAAEVVLALDLPVGADVVPRLCLARLALRDRAQDHAAAITGFVDACGGASKSSAAVAAATYLALDVGNRALHTDYRRILFDEHENNPMVWTVAASLLDRFQRHYMFFHPYHRGTSFGSRLGRYYKAGTPQDAKRVLHAEFKTLAGDTIRFPDKDGESWHMIYFERQLDEGAKKRMQDLSLEGPRPGMLGAARQLIESRGNLKVWVAFLDDDEEGVAAAMADAPLKAQTLLVPGGLQNPMVHRLGILRNDVASNMVVLRPDGTIAVMCSGLHPVSIDVLKNTLAVADEAAVDAALAHGDKDEALRLALRWAPVVKSDPKAKRRPPGPSQIHLRSRAKAYIATRKWKEALADVDLLVDRQRREDAWMSMEGPDLREALRLQKIVHERLDMNKDDREMR